MSNTATEKQISFIKSLSESVEPTEQVLQALEVGRSLWKIQEFTVQAASAVIEVLKEAPRKSEATQSAPASEVPEGMHSLNGQVYKVQRAVHGSGLPYAKRLVGSHPSSANGRCYCSDLQGVLCGVCREPELTEWTFEYAKGAIRYLSEDTKMSLEEAKEFGLLYGTCCVCGRTLTNEDSIAAGIGPVCSKKF